MPSAMSILAYQMNDANLRHAAKTFKAQAPIFRTQATEADRAEAEAAQRAFHMKKRLADMLQPVTHVLSRATMPAKLYRSLSKDKRRRPMKRRTRVSFRVCAFLRGGCLHKSCLPAKLLYIVSNLMQKLL